MLILFSPAKKLNNTTPLPEFINPHLGTKNSNQLPLSRPYFTTETKHLIEQLVKLTVNDLQTIMKISPELASLNFTRYQNFLQKKQQKPAIYLFSGTVFTSFDAHSLESSQIDYIKTNLRILSGLYGILAPLDIISPYRLEMGCKFKPLNQEKSTISNLAKFWCDKIDKYLNALLKKNKEQIILNLSSNEYMKAVNKNKITADIITPSFLDFRNGNYKPIMLFAKQQRGKMARWVVENQPKGFDDLKSYTNMGYVFNPTLSNENQLCFTRKNIK